MIREHDSQIVFGLEQPSDKLMTVDLIWCRDQNQRVRKRWHERNMTVDMDGVVEKPEVKVNLTAMIREHDSQIVFELEQLSDKLMTVDLIWCREKNHRVEIRWNERNMTVEMDGVVEKPEVKVNLTAMIREHDSQIVSGLEQPSDKLMTVDLIWCRDQNQRVRKRWNERNMTVEMDGVVEKPEVKVNLTAMIREHDSQIVSGLEQPSDELMTVDLIWCRERNILSETALMRHYFDCQIGFGLEELEINYQLWGISYLG